MSQCEEKQLVLECDGWECYGQDEVKGEISLMSYDAESREIARTREQQSNHNWSNQQRRQLKETSILVVDYEGHEWIK